MSGAVATVEPETGRRRFQLKRILVVGVSIVVVALVSWLLGWDLRGWFSDLWDTITGIGAGYLVAGAFFQTSQTFLKAVAWFWILAYAYGRANVSGLKVLAAYSAVNFGHGNKELIAAAREQLDRVTLTSRAFHNDQLGPFSKELAEFCGMEAILPMNTGAEAVETAVKTARKWGYTVIVG